MSAKISIPGGNGRMGKTLIKEIIENENLELANSKFSFSIISFIRVLPILPFPPGIEIFADINFLLKCISIKFSGFWYIFLRS